MRLEVAFLDDGDAPAPSAAAEGEQTRFTVLVVSAEPDVRRYVAECLRARGDLRLVEAATLTIAASLWESALPDVLIVDELEGNVLERLPELRTIVIVDDVPYGAPLPTARIRQLGRPFSADQLVALVNQLLGTLS